MYCVYILLLYFESIVLSSIVNSVFIWAVANSVKKKKNMYKLEVE